MSRLDSITEALWNSCREADFAGHDPYDGLKSRVLAPLLPHSRVLRLAVIQGVKRSPVDLRPILLVPRGRNPKALGLFMQGLANRPDLDTEGVADRLAGDAAALASEPDGKRLWDDAASDRLADLMASTPDAMGWGYDFPWQSKAFLQPAFFPTVVCTSFVVDGFADQGHRATDIVVRGAAGLVRQALHRHEDETGVCYSYSSGDQTRVFNASLFAGKILARAAQRIEEPDATAYRDEAIRVVEYVVHRQGDDGCWVYGEADHWGWIDNLHTGFVLETIEAIAGLIGEPDRWSEAIARGLRFYREHLFEADLTPRYYATRRLPLDSHTFAQSAITFLALQRYDPALADQARRILEIGVETLWRPDARGFAFQRGRWTTQRKVFMRWSQAWMFRALTMATG